MAFRDKRESATAECPHSTVKMHPSKLKSRGNWSSTSPWQCRESAPAHNFLFSKIQRLQARSSVLFDRSPRTLMLGWSEKPMKTALLSSWMSSSQLQRCQSYPMTCGRRYKSSQYMMATEGTNAPSTSRSTCITTSFCSLNSHKMWQQLYSEALRWQIRITSTESLQNTKQPKKCKIANLAVAATLWWRLMMIYTSSMSVIAEPSAPKITVLSPWILARITSQESCQSSGGLRRPEDTFTKRTP